MLYATEQLIVCMRAVNIITVNAHSACDKENVSIRPYQGVKNSKSGKCPENRFFFNPTPHPVVVSFRAHNFQKSKEFHELPRKLLHLKPITPTDPGGAVLGDTGREGGR